MFSAGVYGDYSTRGEDITSIFQYNYEINDF